MRNKQKTIKNEVTLSGVGLHTGNKVTLTFKPAPINHGYVFVRKDLEGEPIIEASAEYVINTQRGTNLEKNRSSQHSKILLFLYGRQVFMYSNGVY